MPAGGRADKALHIRRSEPIIVAWTAIGVLPTQCWLAAPLIDSDRVSYMSIDDRESGDNTERVEGNRVELAWLPSTSRDARRRCLHSAGGDR